MCNRPSFVHLLSVACSLLKPLPEPMLTNWVSRNNIQIKIRFKKMTFNVSSKTVSHFFMSYMKQRQSLLILLLMSTILRIHSSEGSNSVQSGDSTGVFMVAFLTKMGYVASCPTGVTASSSCNSKKPKPVWWNWNIGRLFKAFPKTK